MSRLYDVFYKDGSVERLEADDIAEARLEARELNNEGIRKIVFVEELESDEDEEDEEVGSAGVVEEPGVEDGACDEDDDEDEDDESAASSGTKRIPS